MAQSDTRFYNMQVNLIKNGRVYTETVAIKNVWHKENNIFLDIYFHRTGKSFVFDAEFVHDIFDLSRDKGYQDIRQFAADFQQYETAAGSRPQKSRDTRDVLAPVKSDIILMLFMARVWNDRNRLKTRVIMDYIQTTVPAAQNLSELYLKNYIAAIKPSVDDFYKALTVLKAKQPAEAEHLLREILKICFSDGHISYFERMYLADIIQTLRVEGLKLSPDIV